MFKLIYRGWHYELWSYEHIQHYSFNLQTTPDSPSPCIHLGIISQMFFFLFSSKNTSEWLTQSQTSIMSLKLNNVMSPPPQWIIPPLPRLLHTCSSLRHQINKEINDSKKQKKNKPTSTPSIFSHFILISSSGSSGSIVEVIWLLFFFMSFMVWWKVTKYMLKYCT